MRRMVENWKCILTGVSGLWFLIKECVGLIVQAVVSDLFLFERLGARRIAILCTRSDVQLVSTSPC